VLIEHPAPVRTPREKTKERVNHTNFCAVAYNLEQPKPPAVSASGRMALSRSSRIVILLIIDTLFFFLEIIVGYAVHSLALVADSFHMVCSFPFPGRVRVFKVLTKGLVDS
jgi:hypothetical protein